VKFDVMKMGLPVLALSLMAPAASAQSAPAGIAIINIQSAILATRDGDKARNEIRTRFEPKAKLMEGRMGEINTRRQTLEKGANTMSAEQREKLGKEIEDMQKKYTWDAEDMQQELNQAEQKFVSEIGNRMVTIIDEYAKSKNYSVVVDVGGQQSPVIWAAAGIDITQAIVEAYDKKFGLSSAAPAATPAAPAAKPAAPPAAAPKKPTPGAK
jgi:Skp family chaperone for outer membrane proteins